MDGHFHVGVDVALFHGPIRLYHCIYQNEEVREIIQTVSYSTLVIHERTGARNPVNFVSVSEEWTDRDSNCPVS